MTVKSGIAALFAASLTAFGGTYVVPNINTPGNLPIKVGSKASHLQEVVGSGQFLGPLVITGLRLRSATGTGPVNFNYPSFQVTLSTTQVYPNTTNGHTLASTTYASNAGPDATVVFNGPAVVSSPGCNGNNGPCAFDIDIPFNAPFSFDPNKGRLLVDFVNSAASGNVAGSFDGLSFPDTSTSTAVVISGDPTQPSGSLTVGGLIFGLDTTTPLVTAIENSASNLTPGLPNASIAQGAIFIVQGSGLGPANIQISPSAFQSTTLAGTSISVTSGGKTANAPMYYTSDGQLAALLPSSTATGAATLTVSYNGQTSGSANFQVVASNLGIFTIDSSGQGPGILTYGDYSLVSVVKAANPGDTLSIWSTGLGPVPGNETGGAGLGQDMPNNPLVLWLGGVKITPIYRGRSGCCVGEDQIAFTVPNNVPTGCAVPLVAQIGNQVSNTVAVPVAVGSRTCTPVLGSISLADPTVLNRTIVTADVKLAHYSDGNGTFEDDAKFEFLKIPPISPPLQPFFISFVDQPPVGTCTVYNNLNENQNVPIDVSSIALADAGSTFTVKGPSGTMVVQAHNGGSNTLDSKGAYLVPGAYTVTGTGGADIAGFSAALTIPQLPKLTSPTVNGSATRANGLPVTWTGGSGNLLFEVYGPTDASFTTGSVAFCNADASAGSFTIPSYVMLALPPTGNQSSSGFILSSQAGTTFSAPGATNGTIEEYINVAGFGYGWASGGFVLK
jgi:uncharacterized protein (TIGR03437 family)